MLFAERNGSVGLTCDTSSVAAKLMHAKANRSCDGLAERVLRCICISARFPAKLQRLIRIAEHQSVMPSYDLA